MFCRFRIFTVLIGADGAFKATYLNKLNKSRQPVASAASCSDRSGERIAASFVIDASGIAPVRMPFSFDA